MPAKTPLANCDIVVSLHARARARERFPGFKAARIKDEIRAAMAEKRLSIDKPPGFAGQSWQSALYAWNPDGTRCYVLRANQGHFWVVTTLGQT